MELNSSSSDGFSFDDSAVALGKIDMIDPQLLMVIFLANVLKRLSDAGFVDFGVNGVDKVGSESSVHLIQGVDDKYTRPIDVQIGQPNLALIESMPDYGLSGLSVSMEEEVAFSEVVSGEGESLADCNLLFTIVPSGLALSTEVHNDTEVLGLGSTLDVSNWVKHKIPGFSKVVGLSVNRHERLCIAYLQRLEREMEVVNQQ
ncbi:uncharacterized protein LOC142624110 [Castanea sativa]|uniref:uncharacterized protein LOC142624110 n=1 Tax=Castanea sativa TaxID=21020 RepID=UPI003F64FBBA